MPICARLRRRGELRRALAKKSGRRGCTRFSAELQGSRRPKERAPCEAAKRSPPRPSDVRHASSSCQPGCRTDVVTYFASHASMLYGPSLGCLNGSSTVSQGAPVWTARYGPSKCGTHVEEPRSRRQIALVVRTWQRASVPSARRRRLMTKADSATHTGRPL